MAKDKNAIGDRGESIFTTRISATYEFKVYFLGEKAPVGDFILEINNEATPYECMVQVKSTESGKNKRDGRLKAKVPAGKMRKLINRPLPTYVAGVDVKTEEVFIAPAFNATHDYKKSIPVAHKLSASDPIVSQATITMLKNDIIDFWTRAKLTRAKAGFKTAL